MVLKRIQGMWYDLWAIAKALVLTEKWAATGGFWIVQWNVLTLIFKGSFCCVTNRLRKGEARLEVDWLRLLQLSRQEIMGYFERRENQGKEGLKDASWAWDLAQRHCKHSREFNTQNQKKKPDASWILGLNNLVSGDYLLKWRKLSRRKVHIVRTFEA